MQPRKKISPAIAALIVVVLIGVVATAAIVINANNGSNGAVDTVAPSSSSSDAPADPAAYENGTYSATGTYVSPGGRETIDLTVTIVDGVITDTTLAANEASGEARDYIQRFASGYKAEVVGKSVDAVELSRVAGSSLTSNGFNDALDQIKDDARA